MKYNHKRSLDTFQEQIEIVKNAGFNPIAVTQLYFEDTFVFETADEANRAYKALEDCEDTKVVGWWYGKEDFEKTVAEYEAKSSGEWKVLVYWIDEIIAENNNKEIVPIGDKEDVYEGIYEYLEYYKKMYGEVMKEIREKMGIPKPKEDEDTK
jgi:hypothetical protein